MVMTGWEHYLMRWDKLIAWCAIYSCSSLQSSSPAQRAGRLHWRGVPGCHEGDRSFGQGSSCPLLLLGWVFTGLLQGLTWLSQSWVFISGKAFGPCNMQENLVARRNSLPERAKKLGFMGFKIEVSASYSCYLLGLQEHMAVLCVKAK